MGDDAFKTVALSAHLECSLNLHSSSAGTRKLLVALALGSISRLLVQG